MEGSKGRKEEEERMEDGREGREVVERVVESLRVGEGVRTRQGRNEKAD